MNTDELQTVMEEDLKHKKIKYGKVVVKPIISESIETQILDVITQFTHREKWEKWGMHKVRTQAACILMHGPPGCGKTTVAKYLAKKLKKGYKILSIANCSGGGGPGDAEKMIQDFFADCKRRKNMTIHIDECDHLLRNRATITGEGVTWMISVAEELMVQMDNYAGLIILSTNLVEALDPAIERRVLAKIFVGPPEYTERLRLWKQKYPTGIPLKITEGDFGKLAKAKLTGADIENVIVQFASHCIRGNKRPTFEGLQDAIEVYLKARSE